MATRSTIAIELKNKKVRQVYCHYDGYLEHVGKMLVENYNTEEKVNELLDLGDISSLYESIGHKHDFNERVEGRSTFYGRDRGDSGTQARLWSSLEDYERNGQFEDYNYIFKDGVWSCVGGQYEDWIDVEYELSKKNV